MSAGNTTYELCVVGGAGHVGLPLGVAFANAGVKTALFDINEAALAEVRSGKFPFKEDGGEEALASALRKNTLFATTSPEVIGESKFVVVVVGTPIDEYLNPRFGDITKLIEAYLPHFHDGQIVILRSTVYPGTTERVQRYFLEKGKKVRLSFCPERVMQGKAIEESKTLTQIISAFDAETLNEVQALFKKMTVADIVSVAPIEAELAKLYSNAWRYIRFAVANQFFMIADSHGLNYHNIERVMKHKYSKNADLPSPGFASGPCLFKDAMQLAAFADNTFWIGHAAMLVNEGLANHVIARLDREFGESLKDKTVGILGMAFKAEVDDPRDSLSFKLKKLAQSKCKKVLCTDEYMQDANLVPLDAALRDSDIIILAAPHATYARIDPRNYPGKKFVDVWNFWRLA
jgi:UDP-N-acetyl-D-mannosaminuronic acid dehydrogenase